MAAMRDDTNRGIPVPLETELSVSLAYGDPRMLYVDREEEWKRWHHRRRPRNPDPATQARMKAHEPVSRVVRAQMAVDKGLASAFPRDHPGYRPLNLLNDARCRHLDERDR